MRTFFARLMTLGELIVLALAVPLVILVVGAPIALVIRIVLEAVRAL